MSKVKLDPKGKVAFVSGANRGIGKAIAIELLERGASTVYAGARNVNSLDELTSKYGERLVPVQLDVTDDASIESAAAKVRNVDILVNNAGVFAVGSVFSDHAESSLKQNLDVNVWGVLKLSRAVAADIKRPNETAVINVSSVAGLGNMPMAATYSVSKAAVHSMTQE